MLFSIAATFWTIKNNFLFKIVFSVVFFGFQENNFGLETFNETMWKNFHQKLKSECSFKNRSVIS